MGLRFLALILGGFLQACGSNEVQGPKTYAHPAADAVDGFYLDAPPPPHQREAVSGPFYFRACTRSTQGSYFSRTAFDCADH